MTRSKNHNKQHEVKCEQFSRIEIINEIKQWVRLEDNQTKFVWANRVVQVDLEGI